MTDLYIIDGNALLYKAYFALEKQKLKTSNGFPTGAIYGFAQYMRNILNSYKPTHIVAVFDRGGSTLRKAVYADYKANRSGAPEELKLQTPHIHSMLSALGIHTITKEGVEADDIIATIARKANFAGYKVHIISKDKDLMQLLNESTRMIFPNGTGNFEIFDYNWFIKTFDFRPEQMSTYLALVGDTSDNIPGVRGIGKKRATQLIQNFTPFSKIELDSILQDQFQISYKLTQLYNIKGVGDDFRDFIKQEPSAIMYNGLLRTFEINHFRI
jgi:DNA polymerase-1